VEFLQSRGIQDHPHAHGINGNGRVARPFTWDEELHQTSWLADEAARFMTEWRDPSCPFFLHLSFFVPHPPLIAPQAYWDRYVGRPDLPAPALGDWAPRDDGNTRRGIAPDSGTGPFPRDEIMDAIAGYYALVNHVDDRIQYVLERWNEYGNPRAKEPMWVLFSTDHGEMLGDHHLWRKSLGYEGSAHIPFFITGNNVQMARRRTSDALVCLEDIAPTVLDLAGAPIPEGMDGRSLAPILRGEDAPPPRETLFGECLGPNNHFVVHGRHKYLWFAKTNEEQLFDLEADPRELHDLSGDAALLAPMRARLAAHLRDRTDYTYDLSALRPLANRRPTVFWPEERPISA
jgi:arylsulfatase A-like enzyme